MSNPSYTSATLSNYNASPPADDGTQVAANLVTWAKVKTSLADTLKSYIDDTNTNVAAFAAAIREFGVITSAKSSTFSVSAANDSGTLFLISGNTTANLPNPSTAAAGFRAIFKKTDSSATTATIAVFASETIDGSSSLSLGSQYQTVILETDGTNWHIVLNYVGAASTELVNVLDNPMGEVYQQGSTSTSDDTYGGVDRWYSLTQSNAITASQGTNAESGTPFYDRILQANAAAQRMGRAQIVLSADCRDLRGQTVTLGMRAALSTTSTLYYAVLEWTGTADAVTSDVVNSWTSTTYTAGNFFVSTTTNVLGVGSTAMTAATWADVTPLTVAVGASMNNLIVVYWTQNTVAQNVTVDVSRRRLVRGSSAGTFVPRSSGEELRRCQRHLWRQTRVTTGDFIFGSNNNSTTIAEGVIRHPVEMWAAPTLSVSNVGDFVVREAAGNIDTTGIALAIASNTQTSRIEATVAAGLTAGRGSSVGFDATAGGYIQLAVQL